MAKPSQDTMREAFSRFQARDFAGAERLCVEILRDSPRDADAMHLLGMVRLKAGSAGEAVSLISGALEGKPSDPVALEHLGLASVAQKNYPAAEKAFRDSIAKGGGTGVRFNLSNLYATMGRLEDAASAFQQLLAIDPNDADACNNLGIVYQKLGRHDDAVASYRRALETNPRHAQAWHNLGTLHSEQGRHKDAAAAYRRSLDIVPNQPSVHNELGLALRDTGDLDGAIAAFRRAALLDTRSVPPLYNLGEVFKIGGNLPDAASCYQQALQREPSYLQALSGLLHVQQHMCAWNGFEERWSLLRERIAAGTGGQLTPFSVLSLPTSASEQLECAVAWSRKHVDPVAGARAGPGFDFSKRRARDRLRIGYVSWAFHFHATGHWAVQLFELHDRKRYEVFAYGYGPDDGSEVRARIREGADRFVDISRDSDVAAARRIYEDGIDVLVDLTGYTFGHRPHLGALRPAPVQVNWFYPGTMGSAWMDYFIADPFVVPAELEPFFTEKVARLPNCYMITDRKRPISDVVPSRADCGLPEGAFVFCWFNQTFKILPDTFASWMRIMKAVPGSVLWLLESNRWATDNLRKEAAKNGVAPERIVFAPHRSQAEHLVRYRLADLAIDSFPYTSHTTAADALWVGCPLVTRTGNTFASRVAGSVLISAGFPELVTDSVEAFERLTVELATAPGRLGDIRRRLRETRDTCPLFDTPRFMRDLESAYEDMFRAFVRKGDGAA